MLARLASLIRRDLRLEWRTRDTVTATGFFAGVVVLVLSMTVADSSAGRTPAGQAAVLWIAIAFAATLALTRTVARERDSGALQGLLLAPIDPSLIYGAKLLTTLLFAAATEALTLLLLAVLLEIPLTLPQAAIVLAVCVAGTEGLLALGLLLAAMTVSLRAREILLPVLLFPLLIPLMLAATSVTRHVLDGTLGEPDLAWAGMLAFFDVLYTVAGVLLFPVAVREA